MQRTNFPLGINKSVYLFIILLHEYLTNVSRFTCSAVFPQCGISTFTAVEDKNTSSLCEVILDDTEGQTKVTCSFC